jgi:hypothetical protein
MAFPAGKSIFHFPEKNLVPQFFITNNMGDQKKSIVKTRAEPFFLTQATGLDRQGAFGRKK